MMIPHRIFIFEVTMKRFFSSLLILLQLVSLSASGCSGDGTPRFSRGARAFAVRLSDGGERAEQAGRAEREFFGFSPDDTVLPASVTKLVTALAALDILPPDTLVTPGDEVYFPPSGASSAFVRPRHTLTVEMLIEGMLLPSGDDAAYALAAACGYALLGDGAAGPEAAVARFVEEMNRFASDLGCTGTRFTVPDGYAGEENHSTLGDMAIIAEAASANELIMKYAGMHSDEVVYASGHTNTWTNTNKMLDPESKYYDPAVIGLKTGSLADSFALVVCYAGEDADYLLALFGEPSDKARYRDMEKLIGWVKQEETR